MPVPIAPMMPPTQWMPKTSRRVVVADRVLHGRAEEEADGADDETEHDRAHRAGEAGGRRDRDEAGDRARDEAEQRRLALGAPFDEEPGQARRGGGDEGVDHRERGVPLASRFEPALKPNQPTHSRAAPIMVMVSECGAIRSLP